MVSCECFVITLSPIASWREDLDRSVFPPKCNSSPENELAIFRCGRSLFQSKCNQGRQCQNYCLPGLITRSLRYPRIRDHIEVDVLALSLTSVTQSGLWTYFHCLPVQILRWHASHLGQFFVLNRCCSNCNHRGNVDVNKNEHVAVQFHHTTCVGTKSL